MKRRLAGLNVAGCALAVGLLLAAVPQARGEDTSLVAGAWKGTFEDGSVHEYDISRHGALARTIGKAKVTGQALRNYAGYTEVTFDGKKEFERLWVQPDGSLLVRHYDTKVGFPTDKPGKVGKGVRQKEMTPYWATQPNVRMADFAGQWSIPYENGAHHVYEFDKNGKMTGLANGERWTGQLEPIPKDERWLLRLNGLDKLERVVLRVDGRLVVEHWSPKSHHPKKFDALGVGVPVAGRVKPGVEALDAPMLAWLDFIGCTGATLTVARGGTIYFSRGYGWLEPEHNARVQPGTPICPASLHKPLTAMIIRQLERAGKLNLDAPVLTMLGIKPAGKVIDKRVWDITSRHLLEHKAGWQGKPIDDAWQKMNGHQFPVDVDLLLTHIATQRLAWKPGTKGQYDSFVYGVLNRVATKVSGKSHMEYLRHELLRPHGIKELHWVQDGPRQRGEPPRLWNALILADPEPNRYAISTPALCACMRYYLWDGQPRGKEPASGAFYGGWDNTTATMLWRGDGYNIAFALNGSRGGDFNGASEKHIHEAIDWLKGQRLLPSK
jgi:CubicO group peptidase (beta-lactamase class C family)